MKDEKVLFALGSRNGWRVANALNIECWKTASEVASELGLQIATAVTHLKQLADAGVAEKRIRKGKRDAVEYRLAGMDVTISLSLGASTASKQQLRNGRLSALVEKFEEVLGADFATFERGLGTALRGELQSVKEGKTLTKERELTLAKATASHALERLGRRATVSILRLSGYSNSEVESIVGVVE